MEVLEGGGEDTFILGKRTVKDPDEPIGHRSKRLQMAPLTMVTRGQTKRALEDLRAEPQARFPADDTLQLHEVEE
ncbi:unnamed protein product, partial [Discosporangium mesarthrocarpum]